MTAASGFGLVCEIEPPTRPDLRHVRHQIGVLAPVARSFLIPDNQDPDPGRPTVAAQLGDPDSPLERLRRLIQLRRETSALRTAATTRVVHRGYPLVYLRGDDHLVVVNPAREPGSVALPGRDAVPLEVSGVTVHNGHITVHGFGYGIFRLT